MKRARASLSTQDIELSTLIASLHKRLEETERERAALEWTEAVTLIAENHVPDDVYERVKQQFSDDELANLTLAIATINSWNRLSISFRVVPGTYKSHLEPLKARA